ncbi:MAG TPA: thiamine phosphate synthase [Terriglobales bacterium]|nr:thiamine phosphate synthase [Terriglobales bacterium]
MSPIPRFYPILDWSSFSDEHALLAAARELVAAGVQWLQYRNKSGSARQMLAHARALKPLASETVQWIMNDRADLCLAAGFDGVHVGQDDLSPESARGIVGPERWVGVSTHNPEQVAEAGRGSADYVAIGPVFATSSKANPDPVIGLAGVQRARELTSKPLVAIGGITGANCRSVIEAGADSVAVISDLVHTPGKSAEEFLRVLG